MHPHEDPSNSLNEELRELRERLQEAEETLQAIRNGDVDALVVGGPAGQQVYTLENADRPYRVLIEEMQEGAVTMSDSGLVLYCNHRFATMLSMPRESLIGMPLDRFITATELEAFRRLTTHGQGTGRSAEFVLVGGDGLEVPVNISVIDLKIDEQSPQVMCGVVTDLTHSRQRSHELAAANAKLASEVAVRRRTEDSLQLALDAADMGTWDLDLDSGVVHRSRRYDQIFGYLPSTGELPLTAVLERFLDDERSLVAEAFVHAARVGTIEFERCIRRADDDAVRWIQLKGRTYYHGIVPSRIAGVVSDITDRRLVDEQLRQAQKMEAIGQLTGGIAHDFNNLLMVIGGSLDLLESRVVKDERTTRYLHAARQGVERGATLNQQLLAFSRRQDLKVEAVHIDRLIASFGNLLDRAVGETIIVDIRGEPQAKFCKADPHQLETAILNLAINARDAMPQGGKLTIETGMRTVDAATAAFFSVVAGDYVMVRVTDTGEGIPPDVVARVFEPFFTTKEVGKGTGLGLSQVYGFAKQSDGFVSIQSELQRGTTVAIHLPATDAAPVVNEERIVVEGVMGSGVVLVVEDDADVRVVASSMLEALGYSVIQADTGLGALALIDSGAAIDLVFTDVIMPGDINGIELMREVHARAPGLPVLLTSGYTAQQFSAQDMGEDLQLLRKPYTQATLSRAVQTAMSVRP
jgi:PAS domain S-box-containing protein